MAAAQQPWLLFYLHPQPCQTCCLPSPGLARRRTRLPKDCLELATHAAPDGDQGAGDAGGVAGVEGGGAGREGALGSAVWCWMGGEGWLYNKWFVLALKASSPRLGIHLRAWNWGGHLPGASQSYCFILLTTMSHNGTCFMGTLIHTAMALMHLTTRGVY